jgi:hypothetical protein
MQRINTSRSYTSSVNLTRPADTAVYAAGDVIGAATGSTAALLFTNIGPSFGNVFIMDAELRIDVSAIPSGMTSFTLHLYNVTPPSALGDNAVWDLPAGDRAGYLGYVDLGAPLDLGSTLRIQTSNITKMIEVPGSGNIWGYLVTVTGYTPASAVVKNIRLSTYAG